MSKNNPKWGCFSSQDRDMPTNQTGNEIRAPGLTWSLLACGLEDHKIFILLLLLVFVRDMCSDGHYQLYITLCNKWQSNSKNRKKPANTYRCWSNCLGKKKHDGFPMNSDEERPWPHPQQWFLQLKSKGDRKQRGKQTTLLIPNIRVHIKKVSSSLCSYNLVWTLSIVSADPRDKISASKTRHPHLPHFINQSQIQASCINEGFLRTHPWVYLSERLTKLRKILKLLLLVYYTAYNPGTAE